MSAPDDLEELLAALAPELVGGEYVVVSTTVALDDVVAVAMIREREGLTYVLSRADADQRNLRYDFVAAWITLGVASDLDAVGLTAAVSGALAEAGISCNVLAGFHHDHLLVPVARADEALATLRHLSASAAGRDGRR